MGTLIGTAKNAGMTDKNGNLPGGDRALIAQADDGQDAGGVGNHVAGAIVHQELKGGHASAEAHHVFRHGLHHLRQPQPALADRHELQRRHAGYLHHYTLHDFTKKEKYILSFFGKFV